MLVLTRKLGEEIYIGHLILVKVTMIDYTRIKLGIEAPPEVNICRAELLSPYQRAVVAGRELGIADRVRAHA